MRAEVGLLTRNVKIQGEVEDECYGDDYRCPYFDLDIFGGQTQVSCWFLEQNTNTNDKKLNLKWP